jgi:DNA polymerase-3 subunit alpha
METLTFDYDDEGAWDLFEEGRTKGIFQLESNLGRSWSKKVKPKNLEELAALISILRPGCLKAITDGKSMSQHYVDRKHKLEEVTYLHDSLKDILEPTYGVLIYQEQCMRIAQKIAGFNLQEADVLRKAIGKKKADLMARVRKDFIEGCKRLNTVDEATADEIFGWIEKSARYSFNKSHAVAYAMNSYLSAWYKANYTKEFFLSYLMYANEKQDPHQEIYELVNEAKLFDILVKVPKLSSFSSKFNLTSDGIYFGVKDIKSLTGVNGDKVIDAIQKVSEDINKSPRNLTWMDILIHLSTKINSTGFKALCSIGFFSTKTTGISRNKALYEYLIFRNLTKAELKWVTERYKSRKWKTLTQCFTELAPTKKEGGGTSKASRSQDVQNEICFLENPPYELTDDPSWVVEQEIKFLGCPISISRIESSDTSSSNTSCKELLDGKKGENLCVAATINRVADHKCKNGKMMSFLTIEDETCSLDSVVVFPETREKYQYVLFENNNLLLCGKTDKNNSFIIDKIHEI